MAEIPNAIAGIDKGKNGKNMSPGIANGKHTKAAVPYPNIYGLEAYKIFIIDEVEGALDIGVMRTLYKKTGASGLGTLRNVVIQIRPDEEDLIFFSYKGKVYTTTHDDLLKSNPPSEADEMLKKEYAHILKHHSQKALDKKQEALNKRLEYVNTKSKDIDRRSVQQLLTPEAISKIKDVQERSHYK